MKKSMWIPFYGLTVNFSFEAEEPSFLAIIAISVWQGMWFFAAIIGLIESYV